MKPSEPRAAATAARTARASERKKAVDAKAATAAKERTAAGFTRGAGSTIASTDHSMALGGNQRHSRALISVHSMALVVPRLDLAVSALEGTQGISAGEGCDAGRNRCDVVTGRRQGVVCGVARGGTTAQPPKPPVEPARARSIPGVYQEGAAPVLSMGQTQRGV